MVAPPLTIFAIPKRFDGHFGLIQGSDDRTAEMAAEVGALHVPAVAMQ